MGSSGISGTAMHDPCCRAAACHAMHVYEDIMGTPGNDTDDPVAPYFAEVDENWEEWDSDSDPNNGFFARLYKVKDWDPSDTETAACPPVLAFRGTNFEDMRGMAVAAKVHFYGFSGDSLTWVVPLGADVTATDTRETLEARGFTPFTLIDEGGWIWVEGATAGVRAPLRVYVNAVLLADEGGGDWASNVRQGLGTPSAQYRKARTYVLQKMRAEIASMAVPRVRITGHSLGGGLGAAATAIADSNFPDITIHGLTFNAAGVHANTVAPASLSDGNIDAVNVRDEVLTTLQSYVGKMPLVGGIFRLAERSLGQRGMPPAIGNMGPPLPPHDLSTRRALPQLFPLEDQTLVDGGAEAFETVMMVDEVLQAATSGVNFADRLLRRFNTLYRDRAYERLEETDTTGWVWNVYGAMVDEFREDFEPELAHIITLGQTTVKYHGMPVVIASYEAAGQSQR